MLRPVAPVYDATDVIVSLASRTRKNVVKEKTKLSVVGPYEFQTVYSGKVWSLAIQLLLSYPDTGPPISWSAEGGTSRRGPHFRKQVSGALPAWLHHLTCCWFGVSNVTSRCTLARADQDLHRAVKIASGARILVTHLQYSSVLYWSTKS